MELSTRFWSNIPNLKSDRSLRRKWASAKVNVVGKTARDIMATCWSWSSRLKQILRQLNSWCSWLSELRLKDFRVDTGLIWNSWIRALASTPFANRAAVVRRTSGTPPQWLASCSASSSDTLDSSVRSNSLAWSGQRESSRSSNISTEMKVIDWRDVIRIFTWEAVCATVPIKLQNSSFTWGSNMSSALSRMMTECFVNVRRQCLACWIGCLPAKIWRAPSREFTIAFKDVKLLRET